MEVRTSDATQTTLSQIHTYPGGSYQVKAYVHAKDPSINVGGWEITGTFKNVAGTAYLVGALDIIESIDSAMSATMSVSGSKITTLVTGIAATNIVWRAEITIRRMELAINA